MKMDFASTVRDFVIANFLFGDANGLEDDASFLETGVIDSTGILELVTFLEETYNISILDDELIPENLGSISSIVGYLQRKLPSNAVAASL
jgi:acyl carrier protein